MFVDLAVLEYIETEGLGDTICELFRKKLLKEVSLKQRLEYIKSNSLNNDAKRVINKLLNPDNNHYSLDTLNKYHHSKDTFYTSREFLNGFFDFLYPLLEKLLDIKEL